MTTIVLDVNGGEPGAALASAAHASLELDAQLVLVGDESDISEALAEVAHDAERLRVLHAPDSLDPSLPIALAIERAPRSSVAVGQAETATVPGAAFVSAGNAGAVILEAARCLQRIPGVHRSALAAVYPTLRHRGETNDPFGLLLDVGATVQANADDLVAFAAMGAAYARLVSVNDRPRVGLLSNGSSAANAPKPVRHADERLRELAEGFEYVGCVRADQLTHGDADVVVTDGFSGDVVVRTLEGVVATATELLTRAGERFRWRVGMSMLGRGIERLRELTDWENYGGAPLLGFTKPVIVTQSNSGKRAFVNAFRLAAKLHRTDAVAEVTRVIASLPG